MHRCPGVWVAALSFVFALVTVFPQAALAATINATWNGGAGSWSSASQWSGGVVPNNGGGNAFSVFIDGGNPIGSTVTLDTSVTVGNLTIDSGDHLDQIDSPTLAIAGGTVVNNGLWTVNTSGHLTDIRLNGGITLSGTGSIVMNNALFLANRILTDNTVFTQSAGHTIRGGGQLLADSGGMINQGTVIADQPRGLIVDPNALGFVNAGLLQAQSAGTLSLTAGTFTNTGGTIEALDGSAVEIRSGAIIVGGELQSSGSGVVLPQGGTLSGVTTHGDVRQDNGQSVVITGSLTNNGTWAVNTTGALTDLHFNGGATLTGTGSIVMNNALFLANRILTDGTVLTQAAGHTIRGGGQLLADSGGMVNQGAVIADQPSGLIVDPNLLGFANACRLQANGGTLSLTAGTFTNTDGIIEALDGSAVEVRSGATVVGGELRSSGTGVVLPQGGTLTNVTTTGAIRQDNGRSIVITGSLTNDGMWAVNTSGAPTDLHFNGGATLAGTGSIVMNNALFLNNRILTDNTTFTQATGHTIRGGGQLLADSGGMLNQGAVIADQPSGLTIDPNTLGFSNAGEVQVMSGSSMTINPGAFATSGAVSIAAGSSLSRSGDYVQTAGTTTLAGGTLSATGLIDIQGGILSGAGSISGNVANAAEVTPSPSTGILEVTGNYTQAAAGALSIGIGGAVAGTGFAQLKVSSKATLDGTLNIAVVDDYRPTLGSTFQILSFGQRNGTFATVNGLMQVDGLVFSITYSSSSVTLEVVQEAPTPTPTPTQTPTPTPSPTPTQTPTNTVTPTPTATPTATATPSSTPTASPTHTATATPTPTVTVSRTPTATRTSSATPSITPSRTVTATVTPTATITPTPLPSDTATWTPTPTPTGTVTQTPTPTPTPPPTATTTPTLVPCVGDCDGNRAVTVDEIIRGVNIALGNSPLEACPAFDVNGDGEVTVDEIVLAVNQALFGCPRWGQACAGFAGLPCGAGEVCDLHDPTCAVADLGGVCAVRPLVCAPVVFPICGCDRITYQNDCLRLRAGEIFAHEGACVAADEGVESREQ